MLSATWKGWVMASIEEQVLRTAKEIVVKFIETGRVSPAGFPEVFKSIYETVDGTVKTAAGAPLKRAGEPDKPETPKKKSHKGKSSSR